jgi:non-specific serine/threonine protein kinase
MPNALHISPLGHLLLSPGIETTLDTQDASTKKVIRAFQRSSAEGLFTLAATATYSLDPSLIYWKDFASRYLAALCRLNAAALDIATHIEAPREEELAFIALNAPPTTGAEYLNTDTLVAHWIDLTQWTQQELQESQLPLSDWLKKNAPKWHQVGRVCFHLAENPNDPECPFAFMATYAPTISQTGRVQFLPLGNALQEYAGSQNQTKLIQLLEPVHHASQQIPFVSNLVDTGDIYHPLAWTPQEAHSFLKSIPQLEENGLLTRLPNWWRTRKRAQASLTVGEETKSLFGVNTLLNFRVQVALGDQNLSQAEIDALLAGPEGLVKLNGQWIEVDKEKLQQALTHWEKVQAAAAGGAITFAQGMRLLAGASQDTGTQDENDPKEILEWTAINAGTWLADTLAQLRDPKKISTKQKHPNLQGTLRPYQEDGYSWLLLLTQLKLGACLADDMGLGKTIQIIALLLSLKDKTLHYSSLTLHPSLLVLPASLLANWKSEFEKFAPSLRLKFLHPSETPKAELDALSQDPQTSLAQTDIALTTYGMITRQDWISDTDWNLVILDEAQAIKNPNTRQTRAVKKLKSQTRIALTGTPIENKLTDLWSLFDFACPGLLGNAATFHEYTKTLSTKEGPNYAPLRQLVSPYILRRLKTDKNVISDLPEKTEVNAYCNLAPKQATLYQKAVRELAAGLKDSEGIQRSGLVLTTLMRLKQICNHPSQATGDNEYKPASSGKFERLRELCEEIAARQEKVLIFTQFKEIIDPLTLFLADIFKRPGLSLHGGTPVSQRKKHVDAFQQENGPPFFVLSLKAGGSGLTLTAASHVIHFDRWWNPAVENQATDRAFRIGQKKNVLVHKFISRGSVEEKVDRLIADKRSLADSLLEGKAQPKLTDLTDTELLDLISLDITQR